MKKPCLPGRESATQFCCFASDYFLDTQGLDCRWKLVSLTVSRGQLVSLRSRWDSEFELDKKLKRNCKTNMKNNEYLNRTCL